MLDVFTLLFQYKVTHVFYIYIYIGVQHDQIQLWRAFPKAMCSAGSAHEWRAPGIVKLLYCKKETLYPRSYSTFLAYYKSWQLVTPLFFFWRDAASLVLIIPSPRTSLQSGWHSDFLFWVFNRRSVCDLYGHYTHNNRTVAFLSHSTTCNLCG